MKFLATVFCTIVAAWVGLDVAAAECMNTATPSCDVYESCFAKYCQCSGPDEYFITYGKKYCEKFLQASTLTDKGKAWRDKTLVCLQESIVPKLDISENPTCDCAAMRDFAFKSHVKCYLAAPSICDLPKEDQLRILGTVDWGDFVKDAGSRQQFKEVFSYCLKNSKSLSKDVVGLMSAVVKVLSQ